MGAYPSEFPETVILRVPRVLFYYHFALLPSNAVEFEGPLKKSLFASAKKPHQVLRYLLEVGESFLALYLGG